jgi:hypothetical protein
VIIQLKAQKSRSLTRRLSQHVTEISSFDADGEVQSLANLHILRDWTLRTGEGCNDPTISLATSHESSQYLQPISTLERLN